MVVMTYLWMGGKPVSELARREADGRWQAAVTQVRLHMDDPILVLTLTLTFWCQANQREESYKEQIKTLTTKLKQVAPAR